MGHLVGASLQTKRGTEGLGMEFPSVVFAVAVVVECMHFPELFQCLVDFFARPRADRSQQLKSGVLRTVLPERRGPFFLRGTRNLSRRRTAWRLDIPVRLRKNKRRSGDRAKLRRRHAVTFSDQQQVLFFKIQKKRIQRRMGFRSRVRRTGTEFPIRVRLRQETVDRTTFSHGTGGGLLNPPVIAGQCPLSQAPASVHFNRTRSPQGPVWAIWRGRVLGLGLPFEIARLCRSTLRPRHAGWRRAGDFLSRFPTGDSGCRQRRTLLPLSLTSVGCGPIVPPGAPVPTPVQASNARLEFRYPPTRFTYTVSRTAGSLLHVLLRMILRSKTS